MIICKFTGISNINKFKIEQMYKPDINKIKKLVLDNKHKLHGHDMLPLLDYDLLISLLQESYYYNLLIDIDAEAFASSLVSLVNSDFAKNFYIRLERINLQEVYLDEQAIRCFLFPTSRIENLNCKINSNKNLEELKTAL